MFAAVLLYPNNYDAMEVFCQALFESGVFSKDKEREGRNKNGCHGDSLGTISCLSAQYLVSVCPG